MNIQDIINKYTRELDHFDLQLLLADTIKKPKEFIMTHPEQELTKSQLSNLNSQIKRRIEGEPVAYILGRKEFYGLDFIVNNHTLVPRPETELMVDQALDLLRSMLRNKLRSTSVVDLGTGSGCIITSIAHTMEHESCQPVSLREKLRTGNMEQKNSIKYFGADISVDALTVAKKNAKLHGLDEKIDFIKSDLLSNFDNLTIEKFSNLIITANLPYLSKEIYNSAPIDVKKFEPKSALYSPKAGLYHYERLLKQIKIIHNTSYNIHSTSFFEISPEQKQPITKIIKTIFPAAKIEFKKDLAGKWRICIVAIR